jgi:ABC-type Fe3+-hydroxamate transport system substrate-binding protein
VAQVRIVSLVPSLTELLFEFGCGGVVVGRTRYCVHPRDAVAAVPTVGGTKDPDLERIRVLRPTHVVLNVDENTAGAAASLRAFVPRVLVTHPLAPEDNFDLYREFGREFHCEVRADLLAQRLRAEIDACAARRWKKETVLYLIWRKPWRTIAADTYIASTLAKVGWQVPHGPAGPTGAVRYPEINEFDAAVLAVDRILLSSEPYPFREQQREELQRRFPDRPVELIDGEMTSWYGSRAIAGLAYLREYRANRE